MLSLNAQEVFFLDDRVILVEGQEDVIFYPRILEDLGQSFMGNFFGWGVGGAEKMGVIAEILRDLGFVKVIGLLDKNKMQLRQQSAVDFPDYRFYCIPSNDVRTKKATKSRDAVDGILDSDNKKIREEHVETMREIITKSKDFFKSKNH